VYDFPSARRGEFSSHRARTGRGGRARFDDDEPTTAKRVRRRSLAPLEVFDVTDGLSEGDRWSTCCRSNSHVTDPADRPS